MKYITKHQTEAAFNAAKDNLAKPHVAKTLDNGEVHYLPNQETSNTTITVKYNVTDTRTPTKIINRVDVINYMAIDTKVLDGTRPTTGHTFSTTGIHTVNFYIKEGVSDVGGLPLFNLISYITEVTIPSAITTIGESAFEGCLLLNTFTMEDTVTTIGEKAFKDCGLLSSINLSSSLRTVNDFAFCNCSSLPREVETAIDEINPTALECPKE